MLFFVMILDRLNKLHCFGHLLHGKHLPCLDVLNLHDPAESSLSQNLQARKLNLIDWFFHWIAISIRLESVFSDFGVFLT